MYKCPNCNSISEKATNFCPACGTRMVEHQINAAPVVAQTVIAEPVVAKPVAPMPSLGKRIVGMILSITGTEFAAVNVMYTSIMLLGAFAAIMDSPDAFLGFAIFAVYYAGVFAMFSIPLCIVGLVLSNSCIKQGATSGMCKAGKLLGLIGIIVTGAIFACAFLVLIFGSLTASV